MRIRRWPRGLLPAATVGALGIALSITIALLVGRAEERRVQAEFERRAEELGFTIHENIHATVDVLYSVRAFVEASSSLSRQDFTHFAQGALARTPAIQGISWDPVVAHAQRAAYEASAGREMSRSVPFTERDASGRLVPAAARSEYVPVYYIEPPTGNEEALGFDLASDPVRRAALDRARDTGLPVATARIRLVQERGDQFGALIVMPIYRHGRAPETVEERRRTLQGYASGVLRVGSLVDASLRGIDTSGIALHVNDETAPSGERLLHARTGGEDSRGTDVRWVTTLDLGGRHWSLLFAATPTYLAARRSWQPWTLFGAGLLVTALVVGYIVVSARRTAELLREIAERRRAEDVAEQRRVQAEVLADIGRRTSQSLDPRDVAQRIADSLRMLLAASSAAVWRLAPSSGDLVAVAASGDIGEAPGGEVAFPVGISAVGLAVRERRTVTTLNVLDDPGIVLTPEIRHRVERTDYRSVLAMPLCVQDTVIGALGVGDRAGRIFEPEEIKLTEAFADQAAIALENARLYAQAQQAYEDLARTQAQLVQVQKMEAVGRLASGVAHDFNNLLTIIKGRGELLLRRLDPGDRNWRDVDLICKTSTRAAGVVAQLLAFGRRQILQPKVVDLNAVVTGMLDMLRRLMGEDIEVAFKPALDLARIRADVGQLEQVIVNLAANARDAMPHGGRWTLETTSVDLDGEQAREHVGVRPGRYVCLSVTDTGVGMDEAVRQRLFEPFFTTKELGRGTGLGLATAYGIIKQSGGAILVESEIGHGTTFEVYLPHVDEEEPVAPPVPAAQPRGGTETVLVVEDEADVRNLTSEILQSLGYRVLEAAQPGAAVRVAEQHRGRIDLLLTDVVMPELSGQRLAERLRSTRPDLNVLYMSGYTDDAIVRHGVLTPGTHLLEKPFSATTLAAKVREALDTSSD